MKNQDLKADTARSNRSTHLFVSWMFVLIWMIVIFYLSSQKAQASDRFSRAVTSAILRIIGILKEIAIETSGTEDWFSLLNSTVGEYAHGIIYFILVLLVRNAFSQSGFKGFRLYTASFVFCAAYTVTDELHQIFVPGRGAEVEDFMTDCAGAIIGLILYMLITWSTGIGKMKSYK
ncbi:MAG: VanZ family protein [Caulobacteraceae bacterium]